MKRKMGKADPNGIKRFFEFFDSPDLPEQQAEPEIYVGSPHTDLDKAEQNRLELELKNMAPIEVQSTAASSSGSHPVSATTEVTTHASDAPDDARTFCAEALMEAIDKHKCSEYVQQISGGPLT